MSRRRSERLTAVRAEPRDDAEQVTQLLPGEPAEVVAEEDGWARVETAYGYPGWVPSAELVAGPRADALHEARRLLGTPYEWGGLTEAGIDCSGLVHLAFRRCGVLVPRDAHEQEEAGLEVAEPEPGDLACYEGHIAFWLGGGRILHATGRHGVAAVVEEEEPPDLAAGRRRFVRLG